MAICRLFVFKYVPSFALSTSVSVFPRSSERRVTVVLSLALPIAIPGGTSTVTPRSHLGRLRSRHHAIAGAEHKGRGDVPVPTSTQQMAAPHSLSPFLLVAATPPALSTSPPTYPPVFHIPNLTLLYQTNLR